MVKRKADPKTKLFIELGSHDLDFTKDKRENTLSHWRLY